MYIEYFYWHYVLSVRWLYRLSLTLQEALLQIFSVRLMVRTLFSHWHRDAVEYRPGYLTQYMITFAWNQISRGIGFIIRASVLALWAVCAAILMLFQIAAWMALLTWPLLVLGSLATGLGLLIFG